MNSSAPGGSAVQLTPMASNNNNNEVVNPLGQSDKALKQRQKEVIALQDNMLLDIEKGVNRLHEQVIHRNDE